MHFGHLLTLRQSLSWRTLSDSQRQVILRNMAMGGFSPRTPANANLQIPRKQSDSRTRMDFGGAMTGRGSALLSMSLLADSLISLNEWEPEAGSAARRTIHILAL